MGNWRIVHIKGQCPSGSEQLNRHLNVTAMDDAALDRWGPLSFLTNMMGGLHHWCKPRIDSRGSLSERNYDVDDVLEHLEKLSKMEPSLDVEVQVCKVNSREVETTLVARNGEARVK